MTRFPYVRDMTHSEAMQLAEAVVADGFARHRASLGALYAGARRRGVSETVVAVAADPTAPTVVRERALGKLVVAYCAAAEPPSPAIEAVPAA